MQCPLCNFVESKPLFETQHAKVRKCLNPGCGHLLADSPAPNQGVWTFTEEELDYAEFRQAHSQWFERNYKLAEYFTQKAFLPRNGKVMDLGSGRGHIASSFVERGFDVVCVEPNELARKTLTKHGLVNYEYLTDVPPHLKFDAIIMSEVIEHVPSPVDVLKDAKNHLTQNGFIFVTTPRATSLKAFLNRNKSCAYLDPTHIHFFTSRTLEKCFQLAGFSSYKSQYLDFLVPERTGVRKNIDKVLFSLNLYGQLAYFVLNS